MLVSMVFQTLYVLIDLYWVGRLGTEAVAAVGISGNLMFIVLGGDADARRRHDDARLARDRCAQIASAPTSSSISRRCSSLVVGGLFFVAAMATRRLYAEALSADAATVQLAAEYLLWFIPALALQFGSDRDGLGAARHGELPSGHGGADGDRHPQHRARAGADLRLGHRRRRSAWPAPRSRRSSPSPSAWSGWCSTFCPPTRICGSRPATGRRDSTSGGTC